MADLYLDNDWEVAVDITRKAATTGLTEAAAGLTGLVAYLATSPQGSTIHADVSISLTERSGQPGSYYGIMDGDTLTTRLGSLLNETVYLVVTNPAKDVEVITPYVVRRDRVI